MKKSWKKRRINNRGLSDKAAFSFLKGLDMDKKLELLAPAGSYESLKAAVNAGADAVYIGGMRFGARAYADKMCIRDRVLTAAASAVLLWA